MTAMDIKARIGEMCTLFGFEYHGKIGNVDPCYVPGEGDTFLLFFDGEEQTVSNLDDVMKTPFVDGKNLTEIAGEIEITAW